MDDSPRSPGLFSSEKPWLSQACALGFITFIWLLVLSNVSLQPIPLFAFHPLLVSLGLYMLFQGIVTLQKTRGQEEKLRGLARHQVLLGALGVPLITTGVYVIWHLHGKPNARHFISWHGILGVLLLLSFWMQAIFGLATVYAPRFFFGSEPRAKAMYKYHRLCGYVLGTLVLFELLLAIWEVGWIQTVTQLPHRIIATVLVMLLGWGVFRHVDAAKLGW